MLALQQSEIQLELAAKASLPIAKKWAWIIRQTAAFHVKTASNRASGIAAVKWKHDRLQFVTRLQKKIMVFSQSLYSLSRLAIGHVLPQMKKVTRSLSMIRMKWLHLKEADKQKKWCKKRWRNSVRLRTTLYFLKDSNRLKGEWSR